MDEPAVERRHIQGQESKIPHWGYSSRLLPCTKDPESCSYLDAVYWMQDLSMLYTFIIWAVIGGLLLFTLALRLVSSRYLRKPGSRRELEGQTLVKASSFSRAWNALSAGARHYLLPESLVNFFGHVTRLQVAIFCGILVYLLIFTLVGSVYKLWLTPVKNSSSFSTRTTLGPLANRIGAFAFAITPLTIMLGTRENILSLITGIPYRHFNFLHRWIGRIIFIQTVLHTVFWTIIQTRLYQPQPKVYTKFITKRYIIFGIIAQTLMTFIYIFSINRVVRWTGYEFFRKSHYIAGALYLGACWGHWARLSCWMIASIGVLFLDRGVRLLRTLVIHLDLKDRYKGIGFKPAEGKITSFDDGDGGIVTRLEFRHDQPPWEAGQHFFLCFPDITIWQSHPFTPFPKQLQNNSQHAYVIRCLSGETSRLPLLASNSSGDITIPVILTGPYGTHVLDKSTRNILAIAGGTGISFALPLAAAAAASGNKEEPDRRVELVWIIRRTRNIEWVQDELTVLLHSHPKNVTVRIFVSREPSMELTNTHRAENLSLSDEKTNPSKPNGNPSFVLPQHPNLHILWPANHHPDMHEIVQNFIHNEPPSSPSPSAVAGRVQVVASGPAEMGHDLRAAVAAANDSGQVWKGKEEFDVSLYWDNR
ncbi:uncharacterized protein PADG_08719 [Paracoccidioides brasiliensis Pb18]|uniref:FAD-binding FR-type domain-containing protein n=1 Tax=Paracoccidioides brasiliensis (strain Pb18) TaxID=502780 RepID=C1GN84_PARBD|nr:uncharacterized protein PADG_08719 [Paracoccidioides brasiliensis Pb18]EEH46286.2 hypothetical protein PADG_08719 [Paracoccidioides brasiliensis Pb18]